MPVIEKWEVNNDLHQKIAEELEARYEDWKQNKLGFDEFINQVFPEIKKKYTVGNFCNCELTLLLNKGCQCGGA